MFFCFCFPFFSLSKVPGDMLLYFICSFAKSYPTLCDPEDVACQVPLSVLFEQEPLECVAISYPGDLLYPGLNLVSALLGEFLLLKAPRKLPPGKPDVYDLNTISKLR